MSYCFVHVLTFYVQRTVTKLGLWKEYLLNAIAVIKKRSVSNRVAVVGALMDDALLGGYVRGLKHTVKIKTGRFYPDQTQLRGEGLSVPFPPHTVSWVSLWLCFLMKLGCIMTPFPVIKRRLWQWELMTEEWRNHTAVNAKSHCIFLVTGRE